MARIGRRNVLAAAGATLAFPTIIARAQASRGAALVIGNSRYQWEASLPNVKRDAPDIAKHFQAMGLKTELVEDAGKAAMVAAIQGFKASLSNAQLGAIYFAGHGAQWVKDSYLVPIDADLSTPNAVDQLVPVQQVNQGMSGANHRLMVFDNCRNNPADGWAEVQAQRAAAVNVDARLQNPPPPNTLILFSTAPGRVALDGPAGQNSPFCAALMRQLEAPSVDFQSMPGTLRRELLVATEGKQVIWDRSSFNAPFQVPGARGLATAAPAGWGNPKRIVELNNAYAFAAQQGAPLPPGLIAHRMAKNSRDARKIGSYKFTLQFENGQQRAEQVLIVMSVEEDQTAECILAGRSAQGNYWRFVTTRVNGDSIDYVPRDGAAHFTFTWSDANGGEVLQRRDEGRGSGTRRNSGGGSSKSGGGLRSPFTRLDG
jgi:hypothetical protein